jgi:site-specific recombinase XerD
MNLNVSIAPLLQGFFTTRLLQQKQASPHTINSYRDTFRLLLKFLSRRLRLPPSQLCLEHISAAAITTFLHELEQQRKISARTRNLRLSAIRSFFRYVAFEVPSHAAHIQQVLAIPAKRFTRRLVHFLTRPEAEALLGAPDLATPLGRRDHALMLLGLQTGLRVSELISLTKENLSLRPGAHVRVIGKGRKERCTPLAKRTITALTAWLKEPLCRKDDGRLFTNARGGTLSTDGVQYIIDKHTKTARTTCPSLAKKHVTPHVLRHTAAMELLQAGVDRTVIALWLGHESMETTQVYLNADLAMKEKALAKLEPMGKKPVRYKADDALLGFLKSL